MSSKKLKILMVADVSISPVIGGAERALYEYSTRLADLGHDVHILTRRLSWHESDEEVIHGVKEWRFNFSDSNFFSMLYSTIFKSKRLFDSLCSQFSFDVINFHQPFSAFGVTRSSKSKSIRKVYTCHSLSFEEFESRNPKPQSIIGAMAYGVNAKLRRAIEKNVLHQSDKIVVLSEFTKEKLAAHYGFTDDIIRIIPGGVNLERFQPASDRNSLREKFDIPSNKFVLFTVRNLGPRMGLDNLLQAFAKIARKQPDMYLVIGGKGPLLENLRLLAQQLSISEQVYFAGFIKEEDLPDYYRMADIFILPTKELEGFGLVTVEALASGLPVLGTPIGGTKEILSKLNPEFLFQSAAPDDMAVTIYKWTERFKNDPVLWADVSSKCRSFAETMYSWDDKIDQLVQVFQGADL